MNINQTSKIHNPDFISENIAHYNVKLEKENKIGEIQQKKEAELEIVMTMLEKGYINYYKIDEIF
ncbi:MAG: hypothetical protein QNL62_21730 [Gammaproteobacteria bacterium]|nr:hypothetical protein [Gammaproteobacteria bacterium]